MKSGVVTHQDKDSCSDKSEQLYDMSRPRLSGKGQVRYGKRMKRARLNIWFYFILLSKRFRKGGVEEGRWGSYWMRENNSGSSSNWNLRSSKSVFHVCMQLLPKGRTHLLLLLLQHHHHFTVHDPPLQPHKGLIPLETAIPTNDRLLCWTTDHFAFTTLWLNVLRGRLSPNSLVKPEHSRDFMLSVYCREAVRNVICEISATQLSLPAPLCWSNHWSNNGRQPKAWKQGGNLTLENPFIDATYVK